MDVNDVKVIHGDTDSTPMGWGTYGSRTTAVGGAALAVATRKIKDKAKLLAAHLLEAAPEDIDYDDGRFFVKGSPDRSKTIQDIALMANVAWNMPAGHGGRARGDELLRSAELRLSVRRARARSSRSTPRPDRSTLKRYVAVDDCGPQINPVIVEGQVHGGVVQGIGQALWEECGLRRQRTAGHGLARSTTPFRAPTCCPTSRCSRRSRDRRIIRSA